MHAWLLYSFEALTCWLYWLIFSLILTYWLSLLYDHSAHLDMYILLVAYLIHLDMIDSLGCILSWLLWSMLSLFLFILIVIFISISLCVDLDDIPVLHGCMVHDCSSPVWLHVACLCRPHIYPLTSNLLVLVISFISALTFASVRPCVCLFL